MNVLTLSQMKKMDYFSYNITRLSLCILIFVKNIINPMTSIPNVLMYFPLLSPFHFVKLLRFYLLFSKRWFPCTCLFDCSFSNLSVLTHSLIHLIHCHVLSVLSVKISPNLTSTLDSYFQLTAKHLY